MDNDKDSNDEATDTVYDNVRAALTSPAPEFSNFNEITRHTMILPNDNALRVYFSLAEKRPS
jgi:hypothetical protein